VPRDERRIAFTCLQGCAVAVRRAISRSALPAAAFQTEGRRLFAAKGEDQLN
jgi:hypothetical protein